MKIGLSVFDDNFIAFSLNKETKYGYTPVSGLLGTPENCVLVECDPEAPARDNCERTCFSDPSVCRCRCGGCRDNYCDCPSPTPVEGFYEDYLANQNAYNFGQVNRQCPSPDSPSLISLESESGEGGSEASECNCRKCPETGKPNPDPSADASECCKDEVASYGACTCLKDEGCTYLVVTGTIAGAPVTDRVFKNKGETAPYLWEPDPEKPGCYKCTCPEQMQTDGPKKFWRCPKDEEEGCQETEDPKAPYSTPEECEQKLESGECSTKWIGIWNGHSDKGNYTCIEKPKNFSWIGKAITEFDDVGTCNQEVAKKNACSCGAFRTPSSSVYTGLGHCDSRWMCDPSRVLYSGDPWKCTQTPFISGSDLHDTEQECKKRCCFGEYAESVGSCLKNDRCVPSLRAGCPEGDYFSCSKCNPEAFGGCPAGTEPCNPTSHRVYVFETSFFGKVTITHCYCSPDP